ncbi:DUF421 domain-containing protein [Bacillus marinisedimentorum]|uniref:DUF421 domain-containing protein n=1 Tax=Bacillus marinisedimentorum TaxID=1821260 RepID=UPI001B80D459|nr:DUF421 domain-containing protein [Bacillus marinisedimentorum]
MMEETLVAAVRAAITFFTLLIFTRMLGKQQVGNLSFFDYINGITIGSMAASLATDLGTRAWLHFVGLSTFVFIAFLMQIITIKSRKLSKIIDSEPTIVIEKGKILEENLAKMRVKKDELMVLLRQKGFFDITHAEYALLEPNGHLSVMPREDFRPLTPRDYRFFTRKMELTTEVVFDGRLLKENLKERNKDEQWLNEQLHQLGVDDVKEVSYAALLPDGTLYIDRYEDELDGQSDYDGRE